jgi:ABC-type multidrug transport system fused ATPase/permease subunit
MKNKQTIPLLWRFLKGAKRYFLAAILSAGITALADMLQPQIIRAAIDGALGGKEGDFPAFVTPKIPIVKRSDLGVSFIPPAM